MNDGEIEIRVWPATEELAEDIASILGESGRVRLDRVQHYSMESAGHLALIAILVGGAARTFGPAIAEHIKYRATRVKATWTSGGKTYSVSAETPEEAKDLIERLSQSE